MARVPWYRFPVLVSLLKILGFRIELRQKNLVSTQPDMPVSGDPDKTSPPATQRQKEARSVSGSHNDLGVPKMGSVGQRFGRNIPLADAGPDPSIDDPNPRVVSNRLLARREFQPATIVNLLAAAWIQFEIHDWMTHGKNDPKAPFKIPVEDDDPWPGPRPMEVRKTRPDTTRRPDEQGLPPTYTNEETHWWDGSQIYGSRQAVADSVRAHVDGKLAIGDDGLLPLDPVKGVDRTGVNDNWWVGLSLLHTLFTLEHNAICDALQDDHPDWSDDRLYDVARLVNSALMAKIHSVEWTPAILPNPRIKVAMEANWWGLRGRSSTSSFLERSDLIAGIVGSRADHHTAPYAITEEFTAVYRMHPLLPENVTFWSSETGNVLPGQEKVFFPNLAERKAREVLNHVPMQDAFYSFGISHPGAISLHNYPNWLRELKRPDGRLVDVGAIDVLRDRERGVPRYNRFREFMHMPRLKSFDELTSNAEWAAELSDVYGGDIDKVDALIGMLAEQPPDGFGFSDTAFRVFILMASRRLQSDRFFTDDYRPEIYTTLGLAWVENTTMTDVILRHFPGLKARLRPDANAFRPWNDPDNVLKFGD